MCLTPTEAVLNFLHIHCLKSIGISIGPVKKSVLIDREMRYLTYQQKLKDNFFFFFYYCGFFCIGLVVWWSFFANFLVFYTCLLKAVLAKGLSFDDLLCMFIFAFELNCLR